LTTVLSPAAEIIPGAQYGKWQCQFQANGFNSIRHPVDRKARYHETVLCKLLCYLGLF